MFSRFSTSAAIRFFKLYNYDISMILWISVISCFLLCSCDTQFTRWLVTIITEHLTQRSVGDFSFRRMEPSFLFMKSTTSCCLVLSAMWFEMQLKQISTWQMLQWCSTGLGHKWHLTISCPCDEAILVKLWGENAF